MRETRAKERSCGQNTAIQRKFADVFCLPNEAYPDDNSAIAHYCAAKTLTLMELPVTGKQTYYGM